MQLAPKPRAKLTSTVVPLPKVMYTNPKPKAAAPAMIAWWLAMSSLANLSDLPCAIDVDERMTEVSWCDVAENRKEKFDFSGNGYLFYEN